jgi:DNA-binding NtrC family response regulator
MTTETHGSTRKSMDTAPPAPHNAVGISRAALKKPQPRVLVVDDEPLIRWSVTETLARLGFAVEQASDAMSAMRALTNVAGDFDVIVLDLRLPDMNDLSLLATIRQMHPAAAVILMTAFGTDEVLEQAIALGAATVLDKPFELSELIDAVCGAAA